MSDTNVLRSAQAFLRQHWCVEPKATSAEDKRVRNERKRLARAEQTDNQPAPQLNAFTLVDKSPWAEIGVNPSWSLHQRYLDFMRVLDPRQQQQQQRRGLRFAFIGLDIIESE